jgi:hypothetical protein
MFTSALDVPERDPKAYACAVLRLTKRLCGWLYGYRGEEIGFVRQPGSRSEGRPICRAAIRGWGRARG